MYQTHKTTRKDTTVIFIGGLLILLVGGIFFFQRFWHDRSTEQELENPLEMAPPNENTLDSVTSETVRQKIANEEKVTIIDVRDPEIFNGEHIPHSLSMSLGALATFLPNPDELVVIVYTTTDSQTLEIIQNTFRQKSVKAFLLEGGFEEWKRTGNQTVSFGDPNSLLDQSKVVFITPEEALTLLKDTTQRVFLLDVQSEKNYQKKHIKSAKNIPLDQLERRSSEIPPSTTVIVYGESELISFQAGVRLSGLNIVTTKTLKGDTHLNPESPFLFQP